MTTTFSCTVETHGSANGRGIKKIDVCVTPVPGREISMVDADALRLALTATVVGFTGPSPAPVAAGWHRMDIAWLRGQAAGQAQVNNRWPDHARAYPSWAQYVDHAQRLANELEAEATADEKKRQRKNAKRAREAAQAEKMTLADCLRGELK